MHSSPERRVPAHPGSPPRADTQIQRLAEVLARAFGIAAGQDLVAVLGAGWARDNREALTGWVRAEIGALDPEVAGALLPILINRLERRLRAWR